MVFDGETRTCVSSKTDSFFLLHATKAGSSEVSIPDGMAKNAKMVLGGDVLGAAENSRGPCKGIRGSLATATFFPDMRVEAYKHDGRFFIIGYASGSSQGSKAGNDTSGVDRNAEDEEINTFLDSLHIGPAPGIFGF
jgi:hypothetical protein